MAYANHTVTFVVIKIQAASSSILIQIYFNTQITIAPSVDKGWIVIWIYIGNMVDPCQYYLKNDNKDCTR